MIMSQAITARPSVISTLKQICLRKQEIAQIYKAMAKRESSESRRETLRKMATSSEQSILSPARTLKQLGESVPSLKYSWWQRSRDYLIAEVNLPLILNLIEKLEAQDNYYLNQILAEDGQKTTYADAMNDQTQDRLVLQEMLSPYCRYRGQLTSENLRFNQVFQEFSNQVAIACALETSGKISPKQAMERLEQLWQELQDSHPES
ncbi:hypothetical protein H6G58_17115 [Arthrospira platensis FACHB-971]|uniref:DUF7219 family protein n=2 Tax=Sirenicapillariaceae TaxID=2934961 RepID=UPI0001C38CE4|nr:hypothetical protein AP285_21690 [Arthrospira platensis YZ]MBD2574685.1 hypothetical protein [Arthrospira platensis FACHB-971]MBD2709138.1 hypothetical protein [Arthrospira platensis FACHB-835]QQW28111.1 hypothetical protein AP9108_23945 [Arthrospira sp. PCC 9108]